MSYDPVLELEYNRFGRDFIVGDIHGCFTQLEDALDEWHFNGDGGDRLISVGDLVDRGPFSNDALNWLDRPWFFAVRGNHEQMAIGVAQGKHDAGNYAVNGGQWFLDLPEARQKVIAEVFDTLPYAIELTGEDELIGVVHADMPFDLSWQELKAALRNPGSNTKMRNLRETLLWSRSRIQAHQGGYPTLEVQGLSRLYVGHTPLEKATVAANVHFIDTGACFKGGKLTVVKI